MDILQPHGPEKIVYEGKIFEVVKQPMKADEKIIEFETARRSPGVRLIITKENKILLTKEFRTELNDYDYRLPGGKVFDQLTEYRAALQQNKPLLEHAQKAAIKECLEETGLVVQNIKHFHTSHAGATVVWDLFYFVIDDFVENKTGQVLEHGEVIYPEWKTIAEVKALCLVNKISEDRSVGVLFKFLETYKF